MNELVDRLNVALAGRYVIERELGAGGMATVYLAHDVRHDRKVALKVLRPELAAVLGGERFLNEITVTANLQHPNILPIYDSGEVDSFLYYVMPYLEGETLRERIDRERQLGVEETVELVKAVAGALQFAHERGVIHRDIKPENILLQSGQPLVADFGIALAISRVGGTRLTHTGTSLGTPHYMSPEQAAGDRELDARSDVYALGATVYEMLVGEPPHVGNSVQAIVAKIISDTPTPVARAREFIPQNIDAAVQKALAKSPADRFASAEKFADALANPAFALPLTASVTTHRIRRGASQNWLGVAMTGVAIAMAAVAFWALARPTASPSPVARHHIVLPEWNQQSAQRSRIAFAPDGTWLAYVGQGNRIRVLERDQLRATSLSGTEGATGLLVSPDGTHVGFFEGQQIKIVLLQGGEPVTLVADARRAGASWGADGFVYFTSLFEGDGIARIAAAGGTIERLTVANTAEGETLHGSVDALPNGKGVLFTLHRGSALADRDIAVLDLATGSYRVVARGVVGRYVTSGHLLWITDKGTMQAAAFDQDALELTSDPVEIAQGISLSSQGAADFTVSESGRLLYATGNILNGLNQAVWVERSGRATPVDSAWLFRTVGQGGPVLSPDGMSLALIELVGERGKWDRWDVWIRGLTEGTHSRLTFEGSDNLRPSWAPDGQSVMFVSRRSGNRRHAVWAKPVDGAQPAERLVTEARAIMEVLPSPDGSWLIYRTDDEAASRGDIMGIRREDLPVDSGRQEVVVPLVATEFSEVSPTFSPDGRWLAYVSDESGTKQVYVRPFPNVGDRKWQVSHSGGTQPLWSHSGRELFYQNGDGDMVTAEVVTRPTFAVRGRQVLFDVREGRYRVNSTHPFYDVAPDDQRFLMIRPVQSVADQAVDLVLVENFFEELRERVER